MVTSLDFHPNKDDLICSCDNDGEIRYWSINNGSCTRVYKVDLLVSSMPIIELLLFSFTFLCFFHRVVALR